MGMHTSLQNSFLEWRGTEQLGHGTGGQAKAVPRKSSRIT